jgi:PQQ-like domain
MRWGRICLAALLVPLAGGCWLQPGANSGNQNLNALETAITPDNVDTLAEIWSVPGTVSAVQGGHAVGNIGHVTTSLAPATGAVNWRVGVPGPSFPPSAGAETTYPAVIEGGQVWMSFMRWFFAPPLATRVEEGAGVIQNLDTGALLGPFHVDGINFVSWPTAVVPLSDGQVYETRSSDAGPGILRVRTSVDGAPVSWTADGGTGTTRPVVSGDRVTDADGGTVRSFTLTGCGASTCSPTWTVDVGAPVSSLTVAGDHVLAATAPASGGSPAVIALAGDGTESWRVDLPAPATSLAVDGSTLFITSGDQLLALPQDGCGAPTCTPVWIGDLGGPAAGNAVVAGRVVYAARSDGGVRAFDAAGCGSPECEPLGEVTTEATPIALVVADGRLFVSTRAGSDHTVTAFAPA